MYTKTLALAALAVSPALAEYGVNVYWGQTGVNNPLGPYCDSDGFEYVTIAFIDNSPEQDTSGLNYPGSNFASHCSAAVYTNNGKPSKLQSSCPEISAGIKYCQAKGKKVLLSIGGVFSEMSNYTVSSPEAGIHFAEFLWGAYGPKNPSFTGPRPFDIAGQPPTVLDGFDLDIEKKFDDQSGYIAMVTRLRELYAGGDYLVTGAPQCPLASEWFQMETLIQQARFDILWIQFYNNVGCDAIRGNDPWDPNDSFNFDQWETYIAGTASAGATLFIGLPGSYDPSGTGYLEPDVAAALMKEYKSRPSFGGAMVWDVNAASAKTPNGRTYFEHLHDALFDQTVPTSTVATTSSTSTKTSTSASATSTGPCMKYTVVPGDSCWKIATDHGLSIDQLLALNPGQNCNLYPGDVLYVTSCPITTTTSTTTSTSSSTETSTTSTETSTSSTEASTTSTETSTSSSSTSSETSTAPTSSETETSTSTSETATGTESSATQTATETSTTATETSTLDTAAETSTSETATGTETSATTTETSATETLTGAETSTTETATETSASEATTGTETSASETATGTKTSASETATGTETASTATETSVSESATGTETSVSETATGTETSATATETATGTETSATATETGTATGTSATETGTATGTTSATETGSATETSTSATDSLTTTSASLTTSTIYSTTVYTVTSCAATVTNCPAGHVTTETIAIGTTVCPVSEIGSQTATATGSASASETAGTGSTVVDVTATVVPVSSTPVSSTEEVMTTSTIYSTTVKTITSCAATVTNCPAHSTVVFTEVIPVSTTICPVSAGETSKPTGGSGSGSSSEGGSGTKPTGGSGSGSETKQPTGSNQGSKSTTSLPKPTGGAHAICPAGESCGGEEATTTTQVTSTGYTFVTLKPTGTGAGGSGSGNGTTLVISYSVPPTGGLVGSAVTTPSGRPTAVVTAGAGRNGVVVGLVGVLAAAVMVL